MNVASVKMHLYLQALWRHTWIDAVYRNDRFLPIEREGWSREAERGRGRSQNVGALQWQGVEGWKPHCEGGAAAAEGITHLEIPLLQNCYKRHRSQNSFTCSKDFQPFSGKVSLWGVHSSEIPVLQEFSWFIRSTRRRYSKCLSSSKWLGPVLMIRLRRPLSFSSLVASICRWCY